MTVHARGYRRFQGEFVHRAYAWTIFKEGFLTATRGWGYRTLAILTLLAFMVMLSILYFALNMSEMAPRGTEEFDFGKRSAEMAAMPLLIFYAYIANLLGTIVVLLNGAGLIADDVKTRGLSLYLVRPLRPIDYAIGKAMVVPALLLPFLLLPGLLFWLAVGGWQPEGTTTQWLGEYSIFATTTSRYYLAAAAGDTGVILTLSSLIRRRGLVRIAGVAVFFGGSIVAGIGVLLSRGGGSFLQYFSVGSNAQAGWMALTDLIPEADIPDGFKLADPNIGLVVNLVVFATGVFFAWRRARSVEVAG